MRATLNFWSFSTFGAAGRAVPGAAQKGALVGNLGCAWLARAWLPFGRVERACVMVFRVCEQKSRSGSGSGGRGTQFLAFSAVLGVGVHAESLELDFVQATLGGGVGGLISQSPFRALVVCVGWRTSFKICAIPAFALSFLSLILVRDEPLTKPDTHSGHSSSSHSS